MLRILQNKSRSTIKQEILILLCQAPQNKNCDIHDQNDVDVSNTNAKDGHLCFMDYAKAPDKVRCENLLELLGKIDLFTKDVRINLDQDLTACIQIEDELSKQKQKVAQDKCIATLQIYSTTTSRLYKGTGYPTITYCRRHLNNARQGNDKPNYVRFQTTQ